MCEDWPIGQPEEKSVYSVSTRCYEWKSHHKWGKTSKKSNRMKRGEELGTEDLFDNSVEI